MSHYFVYDTLSGEIQFEGQGVLADVPLNDFSFNAGIIDAPEDGDFTEYYVLGGQVLPRQSLDFQTTNLQITADGIDEAIITGIPAGTTVEWPDGQADAITDGEAGFSVDLPGTYTLTFTAVPYLDQEVVIEAVAAA